MCKKCDESAKAGLEPSGVPGVFNLKVELAFTRSGVEFVANWDTADPKYKPKAKEIAEHLITEMGKTIATTATRLGGGFERPTDLATMRPSAAWH